MLNVLLVDDHPLFRDALKITLEGIFEKISVIEANSLDSAIKVLNTIEELDLILLDLNLPDTKGLSGLIRIKSKYQDVSVVMISAESNKNTILKSISVGACGYIVKNAKKNIIEEALKKILSGEVYLPSDVLYKNSSLYPREFEDITSGYSDELLGSLTKRQLLVLERLSHGDSNKQIAYSLGIAETTVKAHVSTILKKLGAQNRIKAVLSSANIDFGFYLGT
ncbi:MAG: response regulator transcription factor [Neptuniibacter sp.]